MIILNPNRISFANIFPNFKDLFSYNLIYSKIFLPVQNLILPNVFDIFEIVKKWSKNAFIIN